MIRKLKYKYKHGLKVTSESMSYTLTFKLFHDGGPYHIETSLLMFRSNQWAGFYMIGTYVMKEFNHFTPMIKASENSRDKNGIVA